MKRFKFVAVAACAFALVGVLALVGCSSSSGSASSASGSASGSSASASTSASSASASASSAAASSGAVELQIFAANSLSKAMDEVQGLYTAANPNVKFADTQYKSSGDLVTTLEGGAYADILITASKGSMDNAEKGNFIDTGSRFTMFKNDLVIVAGTDTDLAKQYGEKQDFTLDMVASGNYTVCVGDDSVPAGNYANQSLSTVGCFVDPDGKTGSESAGKANGTDAYAGTPIEGKVVTDTSVGNVCKHAQAGDVNVAFVYTSDVYRFEGVTVIGVVPADTHKNIIYPAAICAQSNNADAAKAFLEWCTTDKAALEVWQKWGFELA